MRAGRARSSFFRRCPKRAGSRTRAACCGRTTIRTRRCCTAIDASGRADARDGRGRGRAGLGRSCDGPGRFANAAAGEACLYIADIGDNQESRERITIYEVPVPAPGSASTKRGQRDSRQISRSSPRRRSAAGSSAKQVEPPSSSSPRNSRRACTRFRRLRMPVRQARSHCLGR